MNSTTAMTHIIIIIIMATININILPLADLQRLLTVVSCLRKTTQSRVTFSPDRALTIVLFAPSNCNRSHQNQLLLQNDISIIYSSSSTPSVKEKQSLLRIAGSAFPN